MASKSVFLVVLLVTVMAVAVVQEVDADVHKGSCVWGAVDYKSDCNGECKRMGYKGGHCGSFMNVNCWCEQ